MQKVILYGIDGAGVMGVHILNPVVPVTHWVTGIAAGQGIASHHGAVIGLRQAGWKLFSWRYANDAFAVLKEDVIEMRTKCGISLAEGRFIGDLDDAKADFNFYLAKAGWGEVDAWAPLWFSERGSVNEGELLLPAPAPGVVVAVTSKPELAQGWFEKQLATPEAAAALAERSMEAVRAMCGEGKSEV